MRVCEARAEMPCVAELRASDFLVKHEQRVQINVTAVKMFDGKEMVRMENSLQDVG